LTAPSGRARYDVNNQPTLIGVSTADGSTPVAIEVDPTTGGMVVSATVTPATSSVNTATSVASSVSNVTLLASNTSRKGATIYNDSTAVLYVKLGTTASSSDYTVQMAAGDYYEVPYGYTGRIDGIWASANGNARVGELT
jgi:hypothetical protein